MQVEGIVKWFNSKRGYGFISCEGMDDIFVHYSDILGGGFRTLVEGKTVFFEVADGERGLKALNVTMQVPLAYDKQ